MSIRENIAIDIVKTLQNIEHPKPIFVSREPIEVTDLAITQLPCCIVRTAAEDRTDATQTGATIRRTSLVSYEILGFVRSDNIDTALNDMIEVIEEALDVDRTRGGHALNTAITQVDINTEREAPLGEFTVTVEVFYTYTRGQL